MIPFSKNDSIILSVYYPSNTDIVAEELTTLILTKTSISAGNKITQQSDGGFKIGSGIKHIYVSAQVYFNGVSDTSTNSTKNIYIYRNSTNCSRALLTSDTKYNVVTTNNILTVSEGDVIYLKVKHQASDATIGATETHINILVLD